MRQALIEIKSLLNGKSVKRTETITRFVEDFGVNTEGTGEGLKVMRFDKKDDVYFGLDKKSGLIKKIEKLLYDWDFCLTEGLEEYTQHYLDVWDLAKEALLELTGIEFYFTRTNEYYGACTADEEFLIKVKRRLKGMVPQGMTIADAVEEYLKYKKVITSNGGNLKPEGVECQVCHKTFLSKEKEMVNCPCDGWVCKKCCGDCNFNDDGKCEY